MVRKTSALPSFRRVLAHALIAWISALFMGLLLVVSGDEFIGIRSLAPSTGILYVATFVSTVIAILITPVTLWAIDFKKKNAKTVSLVLLIVVGVFIVAMNQVHSGAALFGSIALSLLGLLIVRRSLS